MLYRALLSLFLTSLLIFSALFSLPSVAHSNKVNQATLTINNEQKYQLVINVDLIHLLKQHLALSTDDAETINTLKQLSFIEQKKLLENVEKHVSEHTQLYFSYHSDDPTTPKKSPLNQTSVTFNGLQLQHLKRLLNQQSNLSLYQAQLQASGIIAQGTKEISVRFAPVIGNVALNVVHPQTDIVSAGVRTRDYAINLNSSQTKKSGIAHSVSVSINYIHQGFVHILPRGLDHILFVLALLLFAKRPSTLIWQISTFTLAHTVTLALGIYGIIELPSTVVEPLIALSIVYIGVENIYRAKSKTASTTRMPVIFGFGLLHGLGFASVLADVGLPPSQYALSLVSFNIGVELGQLTVIALAFLCLWPFKAKYWYQTRLVLSLNIAISLMACYWLIERIS